MRWWMPMACARRSGNRPSPRPVLAGSRSARPTLAGWGTHCLSAPRYATVQTAAGSNAACQPEESDNKKAINDLFCLRHRYNLPPIIRTSPDRAPQHAVCDSGTFDLAHREPSTTGLAMASAPAMPASAAARACGSPSRGPFLRITSPKEREKGFFTTSRECGERNERSGKCKSCECVPHSP